jgi:hypothetical protein
MKTNKEQKRVYANELKNHPNHKWAIFTREVKGSAAYFRCLLDSESKAIEIARDYASEAVVRGWADFTYYIVEIKHRLGIEDGKPIDKPM